MVPVRMSEEKPDLSNIFFLRQSPAEISNSGTGIDNNDLSCFCPDLYTCGVSAMAQGGRPRCSDRAAATPDFNFRKGGTVTY